eukprot:6211143-Pleurochrysis_carterae.AAC.6
MTRMLRTLLLLATTRHIAALRFNAPRGRPRMAAIAVDALSHHAHVLPSRPIERFNEPRPSLKEPEAVQFPSDDAILFAGASSSRFDSWEELMEVEGVRFWLDNDDYHVGMVADEDNGSSHREDGFGTFLTVPPLR